MRVSLSRLFIGASVLLLLAGCTDEENSDTGETENTDSETESEQEVEEAGADAEPAEDISAEEQLDRLAEGLEPSPTNLEEVLAQTAGPLAGKRIEDYEEDYMEVMEPLLNIDLHELNPEDEEVADKIWQVMSSWVKEEYPGPEPILQQIRQTQIGNPEFGDESNEFQENFNVQIILDASGSMAGEIEGTSKMDIAKESIQSFTDTLPEEAEVSLRVYGHEGDNTAAGQEVSCASSELVYDMQPYDPEAFQEALEPFEPTGWTPIAYSLEETLNDFEDLPGDENTNIIYLVSDGIETCDGDPIAAAEQLSASNVEPFLNIIGFDVDADGQAELREVAEAVDGSYTNAASQDELTQQLEQSAALAERWEDWLSGATSEAAQDWYETKWSAIAGWRVNWTENALRENRSIQVMNRYMVDNDHMPVSIRTQITDRSNDDRRMKNDLADELRDDLEAMNEENYEEAVEEIEALYDQHVNE